MSTPADPPLPSQPLPGEPIPGQPPSGQPRAETAPDSSLPRDASAHHAAEEFDVDLEQANDGPLKAAARWVVGLVDAALGGDGSDVMGATAVVRRIDNDAEILRVTGSNIDEAEGLAALLRKDLAELTRAEFLEKWGAQDGVETAL
ncbi:hypothetical protein NCCP1664_22940 [Zafaria cholistanensis]|uniref:Uncharacterized protein n=1 Tax=Zafaria cholistanensis TaxID=1682741 RepID=A0A5A7NSU9_9MICC|nr:hypothetical protein [Zafaria cholistanensis]GER23799.1 hypothetical protein NCCP1664_22940 [Zafaria cholistanensis]